MKLLVVGGAGLVAGLVLPILALNHELHIYDLKQPKHPELASIPFTQGDVCDPDTLALACRDQEALLYMAMGTQNWEKAEAAASAFDASVKGVYFALETANAAGIHHAVYTSSLSVYEGIPPTLTQTDDTNSRFYRDEEMTMDATHFYGVTKRLGEEVCRIAARVHGMSINALRLCHPMPEPKWQEEPQPTIATTSEDTARALLAALDYRGDGFEAFMISGDYDQKLMNMSKARRALGWEPLARPQKQS